MRVNLGRLVGVTREYQIGMFRLTLPPNHQLPEWQKKFPLYDRFLPHLAGFLPPGSTVVDIGANVGDSIAGMAATNPGLNFLGVEADPQIFLLLERNSARIQNLISGRVRVVSEFIGEGAFYPNLKPGIDVPKRKTLSRLIFEQPLDGDSISLIKSDTDGFDWDVLNSGSDYLQSKKPGLFFELQAWDQETRNRYEETLRWLFNIGYNHVACFDNYGQLISSEKGLTGVIGLMDYVLNQRTRTFYFVDVLMFREQDSTIFQEALSSYH